MNTQFSNQFFYLSDDTYYAFHDEQFCDCAQREGRPHSVMVAQLYKLDVLGLQALNEALMGEDEGGFEEWLDFHNAQTYYRSDKQAARASAIQQARKDGKLIINHPEKNPFCRHRCPSIQRCARSCQCCTQCWAGQACRASQAAYCCKGIMRREATIIDSSLTVLGPMLALPLFRCDCLGSAPCPPLCGGMDNGNENTGTN